MIKVLYNHNCSKSRGVLEYLDEHGVPFEMIDIVSDPLSALEIRTLLKKLNIPPVEIVRTNDKNFEEKFSDRDLSEEEVINLLTENPELLQRPILIKGSVAMIGRPLENVSFFLDS